MRSITIRHRTVMEELKRAFSKNENEARNIEHRLREFYRLGYIKPQRQHSSIRSAEPLNSQFHRSVAILVGQLRGLLHVRNEGRISRIGIPAPKLLSR